MYICEYKKWFLPVESVGQSCFRDILEKNINRKATFLDKRSSCTNLQRQKPTKGAHAQTSKGRNRRKELMNKPPKVEIDERSS